MTSNIFKAIVNHRVVLLFLCTRRPIVLGGEKGPHTFN